MLKNEMNRLGQVIDSILDAAASDPYMTAALTNAIDDLREVWSDQSPVPYDTAGAKAQALLLSPKDYADRRIKPHEHSWSGVGECAYCVGCLAPRWPAQQ